MIVSEPEFKVGARGRWYLTKPMVYLSLEHGTIEIPAGFETDLASIPRMFRSVIEVNGRHRLAAVLHDYLYAKAGALPNRNVVLTRKQCDQEFLIAMRLSGVPRIRRSLMYRAVRLGGGFSWP